jgi:hypothetical protein
MRYSLAALVLSAVVASTPVSAAEVLLDNASPANWRLQNYVGGTGVTLWFTPSHDSTNAACVYGKMYLPSTATAADHERLWSVITTAKLTGRLVFIYYDDSPATCGRISSFGFGS